MDHDPGEIEQNPAAGSGPFTVVHSKSVVTQCAHDVVRHALEVACRFTAPDYEEISELADPSEIEKRYIGPECLGRLVEGYPCVIFEF